MIINYSDDEIIEIAIALSIVIDFILKVFEFIFDTFELYLDTIKSLIESNEDIRTLVEGLFK